MPPLNNQHANYIPTQAIIVWGSNNVSVEGIKRRALTLFGNFKIGKTFLV